MTSREKAIIKTVVYFDGFDFPLTAWEIYEYLYLAEAPGRPFTLAELRSLLANSSELQKKLEKKSGFYFLTGRQHLVSVRLRRYRFNLAKIKKFKRIIAILAWVPFVRLLAVANNLAFFNSRQDSDFDLFVVVAKDKLPFTRLWLVLLTILFFKRPLKNDKQDAVCLSFLADEEAAIMEQFACSGEDIYLLYWLATLQPVYGYSPAYYGAWFRRQRRFLSPLVNLSARWSAVLSLPPAGRSKRAFEAVLNRLIPPRLIHYFYVWQLKRLPKRLRRLRNKSTAVIINRHVFKTHSDDARLAIKELWLAKVNS